MNPMNAMTRLLSLFVFLVAVGCQAPGKAPECDTIAPSPKAQPTARVADPPPPPNADWCRACVMSPKGFASCQRVYARSADETRQSVRQRSLDKACADAGFSNGSCPEQAVIAVGCKGDPPRPGVKEPGRALQDLYLGVQGIRPQEDSVSEPAKPQPEPKPVSKDPPVI